MFFFFKQKTAYEMRISDWSSDVCSSDLLYFVGQKDCPALQSLPQPLPKAADPTAGMMAGAPIKNIRVRQPQTELDLFGVDSATAPMQASHALVNSNEPGRATDTTLGPFSLIQDATPPAPTAAFNQPTHQLRKY